MFRWTNFPLVSFCICLLSVLGSAFANEHGSNSITVFTIEGNDAILPCSLTTNIVQKLFDWKKDGQTEVFMYDAGVDYNNGRAGQDVQFKGRVSHFPEQLRFGNASIVVRNTKVTDSGNYTCDFPRLQPRETFHIKLLVNHTLKDRSEDMSVPASKPNIRIFDVTKNGVVLQCEVHSASPHVTLQWQDADGQILRAEEPQNSDRQGHHNIILQTTVTSTNTNCFRCILKQEDINHMTDVNITVSDKLFEDKCGQSVIWFSGWIVGVLTLAALLAMLKGVMYITNQRRKRNQQNPGLAESSGTPLKMCV
ncbi:hypothetical protein Q5P01_001052 [Channa striata]|uniref:Ig-like domain-containing protein n=1 Tax=Channa striata TaxID=64152 RepID=A0AA88NRH3_CHASR|nr:hypothetical protein Q5P01_001052 [Channa striata]